MLLVEKPTYEVTLVDLVNPEHPCNVVGVGGWRGAAFNGTSGGGTHDQLKPLVVRVTDHRDDAGGVQGTDPWENFAFFESKAAGQPWKKCDMSTHLRYSADTTSVIIAMNVVQNRMTFSAMRFETCTVGEIVGIQYHSSMQVNPILAPYTIASVDPVAEAAAYVALVHESTYAIEAYLDPMDATTVVFKSNVDGTNVPLGKQTIMVDSGFIIPAVITVPADCDTYFPHFNYSFF
jgi:hypothetical protein